MLSANGIFDLNIDLWGNRGAPELQLRAEHGGKDVPRKPVSGNTRELGVYLTPP